MHETCNLTIVRYYSLNTRKSRQDFTLEVYVVFKPVLQTTERSIKRWNMCFPLSNSIGPASIIHHFYKMLLFSDPSSSSSSSSSSESTSSSELGLDDSGFVNVLDTSNESATGIRVATRIPVRVAGSNLNLATTPGVQGN